MVKPGSLAVIPKKILETVAKIVVLWAKWPSQCPIVLKCQTKQQQKRQIRKCA